MQHLRRPQRSCWGFVSSGKRGSVLWLGRSDVSKNRGVFTFSPRRMPTLGCSLEDEDTTISPSRRFESSATLLICGKNRKLREMSYLTTSQLLRLYNVGDGPARTTLTGRKATANRSTINHIRSGLISNSGLQSDMHKGSVSTLSLP